MLFDLLAIISAGSAGILDDEEALGRAEVKKRKKEEEEVKRKGMSAGVKRLGKVDVGGMKVCLSFHLIETFGLTWDSFADLLRLVEDERFLWEEKLRLDTGRRCSELTNRLENHQKITERY